MKNVRFGRLTFQVKDGKIALSPMAGNGESYGFNAVQVEGRNRPTHMGIKLDNLSEDDRLVYVGSELNGDSLEIIQQSETVRVKNVFKKTEGGNAVSVRTEIENVSGETLFLDVAAIFKVFAFGGKSPSEVEFTRFTQSHHGECQPVSGSLKDFGLFATKGNGQKKIFFANIGSQSTKEELPQGVIRCGDEFIMFQIESNNSWYYEISDKGDAYYLTLSGANCFYGNWQKKLQPGETYKTARAALSFGKSFNDAVAAMTEYRRLIAKRGGADKTLPVIFNDYMHLFWDNPTEEHVKKNAPAVAAAGAEYYVIDCGWHNEEDGNKVYPYVGQWKESKKRFPHGLRATTDYLRSLGLKAGLWIEPEIVGVKCAEMLAYYDDDCFMTAHGRRLAVGDRFFLDFRNAKVRDYLTRTIRRMVEEYGAEYIKFDYNQDVGLGTDYSADSFGDGLERCAAAYLGWVDEITAEYPNVIFETCASGGMRADYLTMSRFTLASTSDQTDYLKYPYIAGNILSAVLPEQAAVWSYPVVTDGTATGAFDPYYEPSYGEVNAAVSADAVAFNMINSFLGRIHLASCIELLSEEKFALVKEGIKYYRELAKIKTRAVPYFPNGLTEFGKDTVVSGFKADGKVYLAVWNIKGAGNIEIPLDGEIGKAAIAYPALSDVRISYRGNVLCVRFPREKQAAFAEITYK